MWCSEDRALHDRPFDICQIDFIFVQDKNILSATERIGVWKEYSYSLSGNVRIKRCISAMTEK
jgi:hypothetical protein